MGEKVHEKIADLRRRREKVMEGGGAERVAKIHDSGRLTARERINLLLDEGSFEETGVFVTHRCTEFGLEKQAPPGDGMVTGTGRIDGRLVAVFAQDFTVFGGSMSETNALKICRLMDFAMENGIPVVGLNDSGGARIQEGVASLAGYAEVFWRNTMASGVVPQISAIMGPCAGGAVYSPAITDFTIMVENTSHMFVTGPNVIKMVTNEDVTFEELGGAETHNKVSGVAHGRVGSDQECLLYIKKLLGFLPQNNEEDPPTVTCHDPIDRRDAALEEIVPDNPKQPYDIKDVVEAVVDDGEFFEIQPDYAQNIVVGFARLGGQVGRARVPSRDGAGIRRPDQARSQAALRLRRSHRPQVDRDHAQGLRGCLRRHELQAHPRRLERRLAQRGTGGDGARGRGQHPLPQGNRRRRGPGDVIEPRDTRPRLIAALRALRNKRQELPRKKHGNIPL
jgi:propionyl-CoA carboxylase beta chain